MGRIKVLLSCTECGQPATQWAGRCPSCGAWGTITERPGAGRKTGAGPEIGTLDPGLEAPRMCTGVAGVDRVLGGGLVPGSVALLAGEPGIGKSTLLLHLIANLSNAGHACLLASGEESREQVAARADRLGLKGDAISFSPGREVSVVVETAQALRPALLAVDSIQTIRDPDGTGGPGGPAQVRACTDALLGLAKAEGIVVLMTGHVTKDGDLAGPKTLEHAVDTVLSFEGDPRSGLRVLAGGKNRFGAEGEMAWFEMSPTGLEEVDPSSVLSPGGGEPGAATALPIAGRRAFAVEIQALAVPTEVTGRRQVTGLDHRRFSVIAAVLDRVAGVPAARKDLFGAVAGGIHIDDPGCDLAVAAAIASSATGAPPPAGSAFAGEISLTGQVRAVPGMDRRVSAAARSGVATVFAPADAGTSRDPRVIPVHTLSEAIAWARRRRKGGSAADR